ncbi:ArsR/SmtB family transcription factor [Actinopolymorpha alba]|uniref:ArsR/SmtB family transcription factor n=1 Tax=Actinopolymorpha alba TaxID=533267 RepID=UPI00035EC8F3|nr:helix-turn-helix domain-containing protein [Actinopolymorpha alba]
MTKGLDVLRGADLRGALSPLRRRILAEVREPASATVVAAQIGESRQRVNYHLRELEKAGLVELVETRQRRGRTERVVRATARTVVVAPEVLGDLPTDDQDQFAAETLLATTARTFREVAAMRDQASDAGKRLVTFTITADVGFSEPADIARFAEDLAARVADLAAAYDAPRARRRYRVIIGGHPAANPTEQPDPNPTGRT